MSLQARPTPTIVQCSALLQRTVGELEQKLGRSPSDEKQETSLESVLKKERTLLLNARANELPEGQRRVLRMNYYKGTCLAQVAEVFELMEARICQIHAQAIQSLRFKMGRAMYD